MSVPPRSWRRAAGDGRRARALTVAGIVCACCGCCACCISPGVGLPGLPAMPMLHATGYRRHATHPTVLPCPLPTIKGIQVKVLMQLHGAGDALRAPYYCGLRRGTTTPIPAPSPSCRRAAEAHLARHAPPSGIAVPGLKIRRPFPSRTLALRPHTSLFLSPAPLQRQFWSWPYLSVDFPKPILTHIAPPLPSPHPPAPSPRTTYHTQPTTPLPS
jgi:hypothetical protein